MPIGLSPKLTLALGALACLITGCARETKIYSDPPPRTETDSTVTLVDGRGKLPLGFIDLSANQAEVDLALDSTGVNSLGLRLVTWPIDSTGPGAFNGPGTGNRALLGLSLYASRPLNDVMPLTFDAKVFAGAAGVDLLLTVDLDCNGTSASTLIAAAADLAPGTSSGSGYTRYVITSSESKWRVMGPAVMDPLSPADTLIPSTTTAGSASISDILTRFPNACLANAESAADEMPAGQTMTGILLSIGGASAATPPEFNGAFINRIEIGADLHEASDWAIP